MVVTNKDDHKDIYKEIFEKLVKEKINDIKELTYEVNDNLMYYFKVDTAKKDLIISIMIQNF